jgi:hypothetical protein
MGPTVEDLMNATEAAAVLKCHPQTVGRLVKRGLLRAAYRRSRNALILRRADVAELSKSWPRRAGKESA